MKIWKILVLVVGLAGVAGFFLPMTKMADGTGFSAFNIVKGVNASDLVNKVTTATTTTAADYEMTKGVSSKMSNQALESGLMGLKGVVIGLYLPAFLLLVLGGVGLIRGKFQRVSGIFTLLLGLVSSVIWGIFALAASGSDSGFSNGLGLHMLLVAGLGGIIAGIGAIVKPDGDRWTGV